ncbi:MAG: hypothetical protein J7J98_07240 [candidate division Zixibacteria bacterium]|nr:hypothetical protein [candidate division Zixibacteria bacterium]
MEEQIDRAADDSGEAERLRRCMSMVAHHEEIQVMQTVILKILMERQQAIELSEEGDRC